MKTTIIENYSISKDRASGIWVVRDRKSFKEVAHEETKSDAIKAVKLITKRAA